MESTGRGSHCWHDGMETPKLEFSFSLLHGTPQAKPYTTHILEMTDMNMSKMPGAHLDKIMSLDGATISLTLFRHFSLECLRYVP